MPSTERLHLGSKSPSWLYGGGDIPQERSVCFGGDAQTYRETTGDFPDPNQLRLLISNVYRSHKGPFIFHLDYGRLRYFYLIRYNTDVLDCVENKLLRNVYEALEKGDDDLLWQRTKECLRVFWPFLKADYEAQLEVGIAATRMEGSGEKPVRNIEVRTIDGIVQAREHPLKVTHAEAELVEIADSNIRLFTKDEIVVLEELSRYVYKVKIKETEYVLKELPLGFLNVLDELAFRREFEMLQKLPCHPSLVSLVGVRDAKRDKIDGIVLPYIPGRSLAAVDKAAAHQKDKWKQQISEAIRLIHEKDIIWGDVKAENIMIDEETDNAVLIDFGGGNTPGWVDRSLAQTKEGDLQGLCRVLEFIENLSSSTERGLPLKGSQGVI